MSWCDAEMMCVEAQCSSVAPVARHACISSRFSCMAEPVLHPLYKVSSSRAANRTYQGPCVEGLGVVVPCLAGCEAEPRVIAPEAKVVKGGV